MSQNLVSFGLQRRYRSIATIAVIIWQCCTHIHYYSCTATAFLIKKPRQEFLKLPDWRLKNSFIAQS